MSLLFSLGYDSWDCYEMVKVLRTGAIEAKFMGVDLSTIMFIVERGQDTTEVCFSSKFREVKIHLLLTFYYHRIYQKVCSSIPNMLYFCRIFFSQLNEHNLQSIVSSSNYFWCLGYCENDDKKAKVNKKINTWHIINVVW